MNDGLDIYYPADPHVEDPCADNPQPCGCNVCCCPDCQSSCHHMWEAYEEEMKRLGTGPD